MRNLLLAIIPLSFILTLGIVNSAEITPALMPATAPTSPASSATPMAAPSANPNMMPVNPANTTTIIMPHLTITNTNGIDLDASDLQVSNEFNLTSTANNHWRFMVNIKNLQVSKVKVPLNGSFMMSINMDNINQMALHQLSELSKQIQSPNITAQMKQQGINQMWELVPQLFNSGSDITVTQSYVSTTGSMSYSLKLDYAADAAAPKSMGELLQHLRGSSFLKISVALLDSYMQADPMIMPPPGQTMAVPIKKQQVIESLIAQGIILKDGNDYVISMTFDNGSFRVNGKPIDISPLLAGALIPTPTSTQPVAPTSQPAMSPTMPTMPQPAAQPQPTMPGKGV